MSARPVRVMMVEDSPTVRTLLCHIIDRDPRLQIAAVCASAEEAISSIADVAPDVVSMDIRLPGMDGLEATRQIMAAHPTPIVVIADAVHDQAMAIAMNALKAGALSVVEKPIGPTASNYASVADTIATQLFIMSQVPVIRRRHNAPTRAKPAASARIAVHQPRILAIAASTGGPPALAAVLGALPPTFPMPVLVVQHMGAAFMEGFAHWLDAQTKLKVKLAEQYETPKAGHVYLAPGDKHLTIDRSGLLRLGDEAPLQSQRPAATLLFQSIARHIGGSAIGVILTGMGEDGARGLLEMKRAGAFTIAEDASTAVVYGMPSVAVRLGAASLVLPLDAIGPKLMTAIEDQP
jgi:two-component system, chemotaxis family, protein-glutamate methylesterase/glutaminase